MRFCGGEEPRAPVMAWDRGSGSLQEGRQVGEVQMQLENRYGGADEVVRFCSFCFPSEIEAIIWE